MDKAIEVSNIQKEEKVYTTEEKSSKYNNFDFLWGSITAISNLFSGFSMIFWASADGFPAGGHLALQLILEGIFFIDIMLRIIVPYLTTQTFKFFEPFSSKVKGWGILYMITLIISSSPIIFILEALTKTMGYDLHTDTWSTILYLKMFRFAETENFFKTLSYILNLDDIKKVMQFKIIRSLWFLILLIHCSACV